MTEAARKKERFEVSLGDFRRREAATNEASTAAAGRRLPGGRYERVHRAVSCGGSGSARHAFHRHDRQYRALRHCGRRHFSLPDRQRGDRNEAWPHNLSDPSSLPLRHQCPDCYVSEIFVGSTAVGREHLPVGSRFDFEAATVSWSEERGCEWDNQRCRYADRGVGRRERDHRDGGRHHAYDQLQRDRRRYREGYRRSGA
jgi:hypothetical protein